MTTKFKFYKQVKTLWKDENESIVSSYLGNLDVPFAWSRVGSIWFTCEELNKKYKNHIMLKLNNTKRSANGDGELEEDGTFYNEDAFKEFEPNEKQLAKAKERFKDFLEQQFEEYRGDLDL